jgi:hypothetical protein
MEYTIWDGFNDSETPLVDVDALSMDAPVEKVTNAHPFDTDLFDAAAEFTESHKPTVRQLARFLGSYTYITTRDGETPIA